MALTAKSLRAELEAAREVLNGLLLSIEEGVPGEEQPSTAEHIEEYRLRFISELRLCAGKCANLAEVLDEG